MTFDGPAKRINLTGGTTSVGVRELWTEWVDWSALSDNSKYLPALAQVGGDDIDLVAGTKIPIYAFLLNGWRIKPQEASHTLAVGDGILLVSGGGDPFVNTTGSYIVRINYQQPVQAISFDSGGGGSSPAAIADAVGDLEIYPGVPLSDVLRIVSAVAAGKTTITNLGGGNAEVVFRGLDDMNDVVTADMTGSERTAVTLAP